MGVCVKVCDDGSIGKSTGAGSVGVYQPIGELYSDGMLGECAGVR